MAKAQHGFIRDESEAIFWTSLFDDLKEAVLADKIACPESEFHGTEAQYDKRLEDAINNVIDELSRGLEFHPWRSILEAQIEDAARQFLGEPVKERESWDIAFQSDPNAPVDSRMHEVLDQEGRINVHISLPEGMVDYDRQGKLQFQETARVLLANDGWRKLNWSDLLLESKKGVIRGFMGDVAEKEVYNILQKKTEYSLEIALSKWSALLDIWNKLKSIGIDSQDTKLVQRFIYSEQLLSIPFVDINGSIWAAVAECYVQRRDIGTGDFYDVPILSTVIPYCDVVTTDSFMKEILVKRLQFDDKYKARIFSAIKADQLAFQGLIRGLI